MKIAFRVDASLQIGAGHVMRCLTLADELHRLGHTCHFICRRRPGDLVELIHQRGYAVRALPEVCEELTQPPIADGSGVPHAHWLACDWSQDAAESLATLDSDPVDWLVVDHYAIDARWEDALRPGTRCIAVIDDLADRPHRCELLLDQNLYEDASQRYLGLVPTTCHLMLGPSHVLLRPEFVNARRELQRSYGKVQRALVFFGTDHTRQTQKVLEALPRFATQGVAWDVVAAVDAGHFNTLQQLCGQLSNVTLHARVSNMAQLVARADLGVGAGGSAMWERCYLGLPTLTVTFAYNQVRTTEAAAQRGAIRYLGWCNEFTSRDYGQALAQVFDAPADLRSLSQNSLDLVQCGTEKVAAALQSLTDGPS